LQYLKKFYKSLGDALQLLQQKFSFFLAPWFDPAFVHSNNLFCFTHLWSRFEVFYSIRYYVCCFCLW
jgi:hypothetical protein